VDEFLESHEPQLVDEFNREVNDWGLVGDVDESEIDDVSVTKLELIESAIYRSTEDFGPVLVVGSFAVDAEISYSHPDWESAMYDSEDKRLIAFDYVNGTSEVELEIDVSISIAVNENGDPTEIEDFRFRNDKFQYVEISPFDPY
jgi:hypothetical protein